MNPKTRIALIFGLIIALVSCCAIAQEAAFFRIVSTQQTYIVSLNSSGVLVWTNTVAGAPCQVQVKRGLEGVWTNNFPMAPIHTNGPLGQTRVPMSQVLDRWIVAFQPTTTLAEAEALFDANEIIWQPLGWDYFRMATISVPHGKSLSAISTNPTVKYVEWDAEFYAY